MGVEYFHGVYATDLSLSGSMQTATEVEEVLRSHGLVGEAVSRWRLDAEDVRRLEPGEPSTLVRNVGFSFSSRPGDHSAAITKCLFGDTQLHPAMDWTAGTWANFFIVSGPDYRLLHLGDYGPGVRVIEPATVNGKELASFTPTRPGPLQELDGWGHIAFTTTAFDASTGCTAPVCELDWFKPPRDLDTNEPIEGPKGFDGLWRTALLIGTHPLGWIYDASFGTYLRLVMPETDFKEELWSALGGSAFEMGHSL